MAGRPAGIDEVLIGTSGVGSVGFTLNSAHIRYENFAPYALNGDLSGVYFDGSGLVPLGANTLKTTYYSQPNGKGTVLGSTEINFTLIDVAPVPFSVTPARTDVTTPAGLTTTIEIQVSLVDSIAQPFDLGALYLPSFASLAPSSTPISRGTNTLIIDPGTHEAGHNTCEYGSLQAVARGVEYSQTVNFLICLTVSSSSAVFVSGFTILNANTDSAVSPMFNNDVSLPLFSMPASFSIQIHTNPPVVTKVRLFYAFQALGDPVPASPLPFHRAELFSPYTLFGDNNLSGDIYGIPRAVGTYHFTAVPYVSGVPGTSHRFSLYVYNTSG